MKNTNILLLITIIILFASCSTKNPIEYYSDAEIAEVVITVNEGEIAMAQEVLAKGKNKKVRAYAEEIIKNRTASNKEIEDIVKDARLESDEDTILSQVLTVKGNADINEIGGTGTNLDREYIQDQLETHEMVLKDLRETLIPQTDNRALKVHLKQTARSIQDHLERAKKIKKDLI